MAHENILVIDDDDDLREFTVSALEAEGFKTVSAVNGKDAIEKSEDSQIDLILLDLNLPDIDGEDVLKHIRSLDREIPVIVLSGKQAVSSKVLTIGLGADDYVTKPYSEDELIARIKSNIKKYKRFKGAVENNKSTILKVGDLELDQRNFTVCVDGDVKGLSPRLFSLLRFFMENTDKVFNKKQIYLSVWKDNQFDDNTVIVFIRKLRRLIEADASKPKHLLTVWGEGYKFKQVEKIK